MMYESNLNPRVVKTSTSNDHPVNQKNKSVRSIQFDSSTDIKNQSYNNGKQSADGNMTEVHGTM